MFGPNESALVPRPTEEGLSWREAEVTTGYPYGDGNLHRHFERLWQAVIADVLGVSLEFERTQVPLGTPVEIRVHRSNDGSRFRVVVGYDETGQAQAN